MNYPTGDFLIRIKNAYMAHNKEVNYPFSKVILSISKILEKEGYVEKVTEVKEGNLKRINVVLKYEGRMPAISEIKLVSKPSVHHYVNSLKMRRVVPVNAIGIISTSRGIMTSKQAHKEKVGGEIICQIF